ncbi:MAG TPA: methyltransferase domain-containing protein [Rhabdochlamydiaceae bacterium]|nr:methyltransferase domain-containing protein [Rhabdochlamydiaceae bacterium]
MKKSKPLIDPSIAKYYAEGNEKDRLSSHRLEKDRTLQILKKRLPSPPAVILDVGGAAGVYAFPLTDMGYRVHLIDPVALHIKQAQEQAKKTGIHLASYAVGDARNIEQPSNSADVVLFFGPLYHLIEEADRLKTLQEAYRVLKPGGMLFAAGIARFASLMDAMHKGTLYSKIGVIEQDFATGVHRKISEDITFAYLHRPEDLRKEMAASGFRNISLCSIEGPVWEKQVIEALQKDEKGWQALLNLLEKIESEETIIGASAHIMAIGSVGSPKV